MTMLNSDSCYAECRLFFVMLCRYAQCCGALGRSSQTTTMWYLRKGHQCLKNKYLILIDTDKITAISGATTLSITTFSITTLSTTTFSINDDQYNKTRSSFWVTLCWMSLCWVSIQNIILRGRKFSYPKDLVIYTPLYKGLSEGSLQGSLHWC